MEYTVQEAQTRLPELLAQAAAGDEVIITDGEAKTPVAKVIPCAPTVASRRMGWLKGKIPELLPGDPFFDPLPDEELRLWNGEES